MSGPRRRAGRQQVRIIGGSWRGRKLAFDDQEELRPTGDRIRETLFNWLAPEIAGARCADLFAGTGALGLEALSRGAAHCSFVDTSPAVIDRIEELLEKLDATDRGSCHQATAQQFLRQANLQDAAGPFDIVFIDPPFSLELATDICGALAKSGLLNLHALVYVETDAGSPPPNVPADWTLHRDKLAGAVAFRLYRAGNTNGLR
jgi:16S rRNA (guanine966-N2)-methyltransferase